ncbi:MAG: GNAT family N-acetyltransferase [Bacillota bacterium]
MEKNIWQGERIRLRAVEPGDWTEFYEWHLDSEQARHSYAVPFPRSQEAQQRWAAEEALRRPEGDIFRFVIETREGQFAGTINTHSCDRRSGTFKYGLAVREAHQRKGYAGEAIRLVLRYFFEELRYQKCTAHVYSFNEASIRLHEGLGFQLEGRLRRMVFTGGSYHDELLFGITAEEFRRS